MTDLYTNINVIIYKHICKENDREWVILKNLEYNEYVGRWHTETHGKLLNNRGSGKG
jgi:hypothetical protein